MMPLPPGNRIGRVGCRHNRQRRSGRLSVYVQADASAAIGSIEEIRAIDSGFGNLNSYVEPLSRCGPTNVELVFGWLNQVVLRVVDVVVEFRV